MSDRRGSARPVSGRGAQRVVELAAASLPWAIRDRYREEWLHDLEHAESAGVARGDIAWGAVRTAIIADRMQAPSLAHAILQARLRIDAASVHAALAVLLAAFVIMTGAHSSGTAVAVLSGISLFHAAAVLVLLHRAVLTVGGPLRFAAPLWALGIALAVATWLTGAGLGDPEGWIGIAAGCCAAGSMVLTAAVRPPKPAVRERVRPDRRRPLLLAAVGLGAGSLVLCLLDAFVILPLAAVPGASLWEAWRTVAVAGGSALLAPLVMVLAAAPVAVAVGLIGATHWARSERGALGWAAGGGIYAVIFTFPVTTIVMESLALGTTAPGASAVLPLLGGFLLHLTAPAGRELAPLPPASVPIPAGPWHFEPASAGPEHPAQS